MVILHNAINTIQNRIFVFKEKKKTCIFSKKNKKLGFEVTGGLDFKKTFFSQA